MKTEPIAIIKEQMAILVEAALAEAELSDEMVATLSRNVGKSEFQNEVRFHLAEDLRKYSHSLIENVKTDYKIDISGKKLKVIRDATVKGMPLPIMAQSLYDALVRKYPELSDCERYPPLAVKSDEDYIKLREARKNRQPYIHSWKLN